MNVSSLGGMQSYQVQSLNSLAHYLLVQALECCIYPQSAGIIVILAPLKVMNLVNGLHEGAKKTQY